MSSACSVLFFFFCDGAVTNPKPMKADAFNTFFCRQAGRRMRKNMNVMTGTRQGFRLSDHARINNAWIVHQCDNAKPTRIRRRFNRAAAFVGSHLRDLHEIGLSRVHVLFAMHSVADTGT